MARRLIQDVVGQAIAAHWRRRAAEFDRARPRPSDFTGRATAADLAAQDRRLWDLACMCRLKAALMESS